MAKRKLPADLSFERKNQNLLKIPNNARVEKRPIPHAPPSNPFAGSTAPKIVYVSTKTPFMSAVKRVQKLLRHAEKRATSSIDMSKKVGEKQRIKQLAEASEELAKEPVYIKATGRAIEKAVNMGKWFEEKDDYAVEMKPGSVLVVDDIVPREGSEHQEAQAPQQSSSETVSEAHEGEREPKKVKKTKSTKKNLAVDEDGDLLESRTRYVNTIEITVTLK